MDCGRAVCLALLAVSFILRPSPALAQPTVPDDVHYFAKPGFFIPFHADQGAERVRQIKLFVSEDQGNTWTPSTTAQLKDGGFRYQTPRDGSYWFTIQTIDTDGRSTPANLARGTPPMLKVVVDTQAPQVTLSATQLADGTVNAVWRITDENLKLASDRYSQAQVLAPETFRLEYRIAPSGQWTPLQVPQALSSGNYTWNPRTGSPVDVRLQVFDRAGNKGENTATSAPGSAPPGSPPSDPAGPRDVRYVNTPQVRLGYHLQDVGRSGIASIEVYRTRDSRTWELDSKHPIDSGTTFPPVTVSFDKEGLYGFTLIARSRVGLAQPAPKPGDQPHVWIEYDKTKPVVEIKGVLVGKEGDDTKLTITYSASDRSLAPQPIKLFYSVTQDGDWTPITLQALQNSGQYVWIMPRELHYELFIRVEAIDRAGNVESAVSQKVTVDLAQPKVISVDIQPGEK